MKKSWQIWKKLKGEIKMGTFAAIIMAMLVIGFFFGWQYIGISLFVLCLIYFSNQGLKEKEKMIVPEEYQRERIQLEKKIEVYREHIEKNPQDLDSKLKLAELETEYEIFIQK